jgi:hypothetical protein
MGPRGVKKIRGLGHCYFKIARHDPGYVGIRLGSRSLQREKLVRRMQAHLEHRKANEQAGIHVQAIEEGLSHAQSTTTVNHIEFFDYVVAHAVAVEHLFDFYAEEKTLKWGYTRHITEQHFVQRLANALQGVGTGIPVEQQLPAIIYYGAGHFDPNSPGHPPAAGIGLMMKLANHVLVLRTNEARTTLVDNACLEETVPMYEELITDEQLTEARLPAMQQQFEAGYRARLSQQRTILQHDPDGIRPDRQLVDGHQPNVNDVPVPQLTATANVPFDSPQRVETIRLLRRCLPYRQYRTRAAEGDGWEQHYKFRVSQHIDGSRHTLVWKIRRCPHCGLIVHRDLNAALNILFVGVHVSCTPPYERPESFAIHQHAPHPEH